MKRLVQDVVYAIRTLNRSRAFALTSIITLALGIGAATAIFSVVNAVLLRPLPYAEPERLMLIQSDLTARNVPDFPLPPGDLPDMRSGGTLFQEIAAVVTNRFTFNIEEDEPELVTGAGVTTNFMRTLGARIIAGRDFTDEDGRAPQPAPQNTGAPQAVNQTPPPPLPTMTILSHGFWQRRFGGDSTIVGRQFRNGQQVVEVIGIVGPEFELNWPASSNIETHPDFYTAMRTDFANGSRVNVFLRTVGRLKPGVTQPQAQAQIDGIVKELRQRFPVKETAGLRWRVEPMHQYVTAEVTPTLRALMGAVIFVLLIACANVANLILVRTNLRERELAVRAALGGNRAALFRQLLVESLVLGAAGAVLGLMLANAGVSLLRAIGPERVPRLEQVTVDTTVLLFATATSFVTALLFGMVPAVRASRVRIHDILQSAGRSAALARSGKWIRQGIVIAEVALAFVLLVGAGLMMRSFVTLMRTDPGFQTEGVLTFLIPNMGRPTPEERSALVRDIRTRIEAVPGVTAVTAATPLPLENVPANARWGTEAALADPALFQQADVRTVQPNYFSVLGTPVLDGRVFEDPDNAQGTGNIVVDDVFAQKAFPNTSAVGKRVLLRLAGPEPTWYNIIGVVRQQRNAGLAAPSRETVYIVDGEFGFGATNRWLVKTDRDLAALGDAVRRAVHEVDAAMVMADMRPMADLVANAVAPTRFALVCIGIFAAIAALLAGVGLYGVLATTVTERTAEIGVRMALGATAQRVFAMLLRQGAVLTLVGIAAGIVSAVALTRLLQAMVVGVKPTDLPTFAATALAFLAVAMFACWLPARRAARLEPMVALQKG